MLRLLVLMLLCACASAPRPEQSFDVAPLADFEDHQFRGVEQLLARFDRRASEGRSACDVALFGVSVHRGERVWHVLLWMESDDEWRATSGDDAERTVAVRHCSQDGKVVVRTDLVQRHGASSAAPGERACGRMFVDVLRGLLGSDAALRVVLFSIVEKPGILSVIANVGVRVTVSWHDPDLGPIDWPDEAWRQQIGAGELQPLQVEIAANGAPALRGDLLVCEHADGTAMSDGVCAAVFRHPTDAQRFAVVKLLAVKQRRD